MSATDRRFCFDARMGEVVQAPISAYDRDRTGATTGVGRTSAHDRDRTGDPTGARADGGVARP